MIKIVLLSGDGIGREVTAEAVSCLELLSEHLGLGLRFEEHAFGGAAIDRHGDPLPEATLNACRDSDAVLLGAVGGPQWDDAAIRPEASLLEIRQELGLFANMRPVRVVPGLEDMSPLRADIAEGADILIVRELIGGIYFGPRSASPDSASDTAVYTRAEIERIVHVAFRAARRRRGKLTSVDKANVLATSRLWRVVVREVAVLYPDVEVEHVFVDACAMTLVTNPRRFDVIVTDNLFGDILSDELSVISGSIGLLGSASVGHLGPGLFEPVHGSAPDIAGLDIANPSGMIASAVLMLEHLGLAESGDVLMRALEQTLLDGCRTADLGGSARCSEFGRRVRENLRTQLTRHDAHLELVAMNRGCCA